MFLLWLQHVKTMTQIVFCLYGKYIYKNGTNWNVQLNFLPSYVKNRFQSGKAQWSGNCSYTESCLGLLSRVLINVLEIWIPIYSSSQSELNRNRANRWYQTLISCISLICALLLNSITKCNIVPTISILTKGLFTGVTVWFCPVRCWNESYHIQAGFLHS